MQAVESESECVGRDRRKEGFQKERPDLDLTLTVRRSDEHRDGAVPHLLDGWGAAGPAEGGRRGGK